jgi:hypothetical protein
MQAGWVVWARSGIGESTGQVPRETDFVGKLALDRSVDWITISARTFVGVRLRTETFPAKKTCRNCHSFAGRNFFTNGASGLTVSTTVVELQGCKLMI